MDKITVSGGNRLYGDIYIDGMKNAALPIIFATIVSGGKCQISNLPPVSDIRHALDILKSMGANVRLLNKNTAEIDTAHVICGTAPYNLTSKMRASTYLLGAELGRFGTARVGAPGGCDFGTRPIDQHLKGFRALGAIENIGSQYISLYLKENLHGGRVRFDVVSVGATCNVIIAAVLANGETVISNAAKEPHIVDLANFLNSCGADIQGAGTDTIRIKGVKKLHGCKYTILPDMIEAGTYMTAVASAGGRVNIRNVVPKHLEAVTHKLREMGVEVEEHDDYVTVCSNGVLSPVNITTAPYPGFPTDMQPQFGALMSLADGVSRINEGVWENRFKYLNDISKFGSSVSVNGATALISGSPLANGCDVNSVDLRAGAAMVVAALAAKGKTTISGLETLDRGYFDLVGKLRAVGANIERTSTGSGSGYDIALYN